MLIAGDIDMGHARALLAVDAVTQVQLAQQVVQKQLSVRETEKLVTQTLAQSPGTIRKTSKPQDGDSKRLAERLSDALGATVELQMSKGGKGKLVVQFSGLDVLQGIIEKLGVQES
jgi:ParB family chromosome partitioning protein